MIALEERAIDAFIREFELLGGALHVQPNAPMPPGVDERMREAKVRALKSIAPDWHGSVTADPKERNRYTIAVDFDGVIHSYTSGWAGADQCPDPPVDGAIDFLHEMVEVFDVVIMSTRGDQPGGSEAVMAYLRTWGYTGPELRVTREKVPALIYLDDRGWRFGGPGTWPTVQQIHDARPWNRPKGVAA